MPSPTTPDVQVLDRLRAAINAPDPARIAACVPDDYRAELPHHPERSFTGNDTVRRNWTAMLEAVPDINTVVLRTATSGAEIWSEWEMAGTGPEGTAFTFIGPVILTTQDGRIDWTRFYLDRADPPAPRTA